MVAYRALVVDDSRSARVALGRMLKSFGLQVDDCESAEDALVYLHDTKPDIIFLDHLMPGMDGFAALRAFKSNPDTAKIPVCMYTSQEGVQFESQVKDWGAVGVFSKTATRADLARLLSQLNFLSSTQVQDVTAEPVLPPFYLETAAIKIPPVMRHSAEESDALTLRLYAQDAELRQHMAASLDAFSQHILADVKTMLSKQGEQKPPPPPRTFWNQSFWGFAFGLLVAALCAGSLALLLQMNQQPQAVAGTDQNALLSQFAVQQQKLGALQEQIEQLKAMATASAVATTPSAKPIATAALLQTSHVPYGQIPLSGERLDTLRALVTRLNSEQAHGVVYINSYPGAFCLTGNGNRTYSEADKDSLAKDCDVIGNPFDDTLKSAQRLSVPFINYLRMLGEDKQSTIRVIISNNGRSLDEEYPPQTDTLTAGEWNAVAMLNNRVEFSFLADP